MSLIFTKLIIMVAMCDFLLDSDFSAVFESIDIEFIWSVIKCLFSKLCLCLPLRFM